MHMLVAFHIKLGNIGKLNSYTFIPIYGSKFQNLGGKKMDNFLTSQKLPLHGPANNQSVTFSKIHTKVCRTPWTTPMD